MSLESCTTETIRLQPHHDASTHDAVREVEPSCAPGAPDACPGPVPSYSRDLVPILEAKCNGCHTGHDGAPWPLTNYPDVLHWRAQVLAELAGCTMPPPAGTTQLTAGERAALIDWLVCGAPEN
jgi:hypothetical protein